METDPPPTDSRLQRPLRRCRHIPQHATDFSKTDPYDTKLTGTSTPSQVTLYCRLLRTSSISPLDFHAAVPLNESTIHDRAEDGVRLPGRCSTGLICLTTQEGGDVEQIVVLAQARSVVALERGQPRLHDLLCRLGSRTWCGFRCHDAGAAHSGHPFDKAGYPPLRFWRRLLDRRSWRDRRLGQRNRAGESSVDRLRNNERAATHSRVLGCLRRMRQWFAVVLRAQWLAAQRLPCTIHRRLRCILGEQGLGVCPRASLAQSRRGRGIPATDQADHRPDLRDRFRVNTQAT